MMNRYRPLFHALPLVALALASAACERTAGGGTGSQGARLSSSNDLEPDRAPGDQATLLLANIPVPVTVEREQANGAVTFSLVGEHGQMIEEERYVSNSTEFSLAQAAGEFYEPPITLLKFPMNVGDSWEWQGTMRAGNISREASASILSSPGEVVIAGQREAVKIRVDLEMESGGPETAKRTLTFWFVPQQGLVKREFGAGSSRIPSEP
jgi:hypothetical protein